MPYVCLYATSQYACCIAHWSAKNWSRNVSSHIATAFSNNLFAVLYAWCGIWQFIMEKNAHSQECILDHTCMIHEEFGGKFIHLAMPFVWWAIFFIQYGRYFSSSNALLFILAVEITLQFFICPGPCVPKETLNFGKTRWFVDPL